MDNVKKRILTFAKAQCSAWVASAVDFGLTLTLANGAGLWYGHATLAGAVGGGMTNCAINYRWVFHAFGMKKKYVAMRYVMVWVGSIVLNTYGTYLTTESTGLNFMLSKAGVAALVAVFWNYQMQSHFVFHRKDKLSSQHTNIDQ